MAIEGGLCGSFRSEILFAMHSFGVVNPARDADTPDTFKIALYTSAANLSPDTTAYTTEGEVVDSGYTAGGQILTITQTPTTTSRVGWVNFADPTWYSTTLAAAGALIYNATQGNRAVMVLSFGGTKTPINGVFVVRIPTDGPTTALLRIR